MVVMCRQCICLNAIPMPLLIVPNNFNNVVCIIYCSYALYILLHFDYYSDLCTCYTNFIIIIMCLYEYNLILNS